MEPTPAPTATSWRHRLRAAPWLVSDGSARRRLLRRLLVAALVLGGCELWVRANSGTLDRALLDGYRLPDVVVPPLAELAAVLQRRRQSGGLDGRQVVGLAGPSSVWGYGVGVEQTLARRLQHRLDEAPRPPLVLNLALPRNRYADDRMVAGYFAGRLDWVLVPYSAFLAESLVAESCPSHLPILEWSGLLPEPFLLPAPCAQPPRHHGNARLESLVSTVWATYAARVALRHRLFPKTQDFGRALAAPILRSDSVDGKRARQALLGRQFVVRPPTSAAPLPVDARILSEVERLCQSYAAAGTGVAFYHLPSVATRPDSPREAALLGGLEAAIAHVALKQPRCRRLELPLPTPLIPADDYLDEYHPGPSGLDKLAAGLAAALPTLGEPRR